LSGDVTYIALHEKSYILWLEQLELVVVRPGFDYLIELDQNTLKVVLRCIRSFPA